MVDYLQILLPGLQRLGEIGLKYVDYVLIVLPLLALLGFIAFLMGVIFRD